MHVDDKDSGGQLRAFEMNLYDETSRGVFSFTRPLQHDARCCLANFLCETPAVWWLQCTSFMNRQSLQRIFVRCPLTNQICGTVCQTYDPWKPSFVCIDEFGQETMRIVASDGWTVRRQVMLTVSCTGLGF